jgi:HEAT repeat protein
MRKLAWLLLVLCACKPPDPKAPQTWIARLADPDAKVRIAAVQQLRKLKAKPAAPQIAQLLRDPLVKEEAALALQDLGGPAELPSLLEAVDTTVGAGSDQATRVANRTNAKIADALGDIGDPRGGPTLLRLARSKDDLVRLTAVQSLGQVRFKDAVPELSHIVDDEAAPPILIKKAIVALGDIGDPAAIPALEHGLVLERQGVSFLPESSYALFLLGPAAVGPMLKLAQDEDPQYLAWAKENNRAAAGTYAKAALVLGDLEDPRAIPVLLARLKYSDNDPNPGTAHLLSNLVRQFAASALGRLRAKEAAAPILALVQTKDPQDEDLVTSATEALVWIGEPITAKELAKRAQAGAVRLRLLAAQGAALYGEPPLAKELLAIAAKEAKGSAAGCQQKLAELQLPTADAGSACELLATQFGALADRPFLAAQKCAGVPACWAQSLGDKDAIVRARAAYELGRGGVASAVPALGKAAADDSLLVRVAAIRALDWLAQVPAAKPLLQTLAPQLAAQLEAEQGRVQTVRVNEELRRLHTRLARL